MATRGYGTGQLYETHGSYYGRWWTLDGQRVNRLIGPIRPPGKGSHATGRLGRLRATGSRGVTTTTAAVAKAKTNKTEEVHMNTAPQAQGLKRTDIQEHDLSLPGRQVIQNRVDISPDAPLFRHKHPGEEVIYVLEGSLQYDIDGQPPTRVSAGEGLVVPAETVHAVKNIGTGNAAELATYIVEKGKPFLVAVD